MTGDARQLVKEGRVTATFPERHTCRVSFEDKDDLVGPEMPVLTMCAFGDKFFGMPDVGDIVVCLMASNADQTGTGWIIGSRFNDKSTPNADSIDKTRLDFKDKTSVEYDRNKHTMTIKFKDNSSWQYDAGKGKFQFAFKDGTFITHDAEAKKTQLTCAGELRINAVEDIFIDGRTINLNMGGE